MHSLLLRHHLLVNKLTVKCIKHHITSPTICLSSLRWSTNMSHLRPKCLQLMSPVLTSDGNGRHFATSSVCQFNVENYTPFDTMDGVMYKVRRYLGWSSIPKYRLRHTSVYLYESATDGIDIEKFFNHLKLPDTYLSWFLVTQLHVWMLMVRAMVEGKEGRILRNELVARMWDDCDERLKHLTLMSPKVRRKGLEDLTQQFQASMFAYDEGHLTTDKALAAALWRTLFAYETIDPKYIEVMVNYVRTQLEHLHTISTEKYFLDGKIIWTPFPSLYP